jgi:hypothetical protein
MKRAIFGVLSVLFFTVSAVMAEMGGETNSAATVCAPEPATFAVLALGSVAFLLNRRR